MADRQEKFYIDFADTVFLQTSQVGAKPRRLNWRCEVLLTRHRQDIEGKKVLDLASHDGRFSHACLKLGASHVTGVEGRQYLIDTATQTMTSLGYSSKQYDFIQGDVYDYMKEIKPGQYDTILCLGIFDHTVRQIEMVRELQRLKPDCFILDLFVEKGSFINPRRWFSIIGSLRPGHFAHMSDTMGRARRTARREGGSVCLVFKPESHQKEWATIDSVDLSAYPTPGFIETIFPSHGCSVERLDWRKQGIRDWTDLTDYRSGIRASYVIRPLPAEATS